MPYDYITNTYLNKSGNYVIRGLMNYDFTPDDDMQDGCDMPDFDDADEADDVSIEDVNNDKEEDEEDEEFDAERFFSEYEEAKKVFEKFDLDESDCLCADELPAALKMMGQFVHEETIEEILEEYECVGFAEFLQILKIEAPEEEDGGR